MRSKRTAQPANMARSLAAAGVTGGLGRVCKMWRVTVPGHGNDGQGNEREVLSSRGRRASRGSSAASFRPLIRSQREGGDCECAEARADIRPRPIRNQNSRTDVMGSSEPP